MDSNRLLLKVAEAADALGVSRAKAYQLIAEGAIPSIRLGGSRGKGGPLRVPVDELRKRIAEEARKSQNDAASM